MSSVMVILSGGQDSTTCLLEAHNEFRMVHACTFDYGQKHRIEIEQAREVANIVGVDSHTVIDVRGLLRGRSPLVDPGIALETYTDFASMDKIIGGRVELTFVPLRNPFFLLVATNLALSMDVFDLMTGVCAMDNANYPDCTLEFVASAEEMINQALGFNDEPYRRNGGRRVAIHAPLLTLTKAETVHLALRHGDLGRRALAASHTCYAGQRPPCGECHACVLRAEGFRQAAVPDPLVVAAGGIAA